MSRIISPEMPAVVADPADDLAVMAVEGEGDAHDLAVPAGELQPSEHQRQFERIVATWPSCSRGRRRPVWRGEQQAVLLHQPVDALGVDRGQTVGSPLALEERGDPPVPVGRPRVDQAADRGGELDIAGAGLAARASAVRR